MNTHLSPAQYRQAADVQERIEELQQQLAQLLDGGEIPIPSSQPTGKNKMSAAGRAAISAAAKARWAKIRSAKGPGKITKKNKMSAAGRAAIAAAMKARWAKAKKAGKSTL